MKRVKSISIACAVMLTFASCVLPDTNSGNQSSGTENSATETETEKEETEELYENVTLSPVTYSFIRGFDASEVDYYEEKYSVSWKDTDGTAKDIFALLKSYGVNTVRLRIWHDPSQFDEKVNYGDNTLERTIKMAKRVKEAGLDLMLDIHYSDTWADPGHQIVPAAWKDLSSADAVASKVSEYTTEVLTAIKIRAGIIPRYVQVGNEINPGLLCVTANSTNNLTATTAFAYAGASYEDGNSNFTPTNMVKYLKAGADAVRAFNSDIKIVLHLAGDSNPDDSWFFDPVKNGGVPFDIIGYSFYPWETSGCTISVLKQKIENQKSKYGVDVIVAECSSHWKDITSDLSGQKNAYNAMINPATSSVYSDLETGTDSGEYYLKGTEENQTKVLTHVMEETFASGGAGFFTWGGDKYGDYKWGMFDSSCKALSSMSVFSTELTASTGGTESATATLYDADVTGTGANVTLLKAAVFSSLTESNTVTVSFVWVSDADGAGTGSVSCGAGSTWPAVGWEDDVGTATFTGDSIAALKSNGLTVWIPSGVTYRVKVLAE